MAKPARRSAQHLPVGSPPRKLVYLKKEELQRVDELRINTAMGTAQNKPDVQSTLELMYLRVLGGVKNRGPLEADLKELKKTLDQAAAKMNEIIEKSERQAPSSNLSSTSPHIHKPSAQTNGHATQRGPDSK